MRVYLVVPDHKDHRCEAKACRPSMSRRKSNATRTVDAAQIVILFMFCSERP